MLERKKLLRTEEDIVNAAIYNLEIEKLNNLENTFFSEIDLIESVESKIKKFNKTQKNVFIKPLIKLLQFFNAIKIKDPSSLYEQKSKEALEKVLKQNIVIIEVDRLYQLYQNNNLVFSMKDIEYILESKKVLEYMTRNNMYKKDFFMFILEEIKESKPKDLKNFGNGKIKNIIRQLEDIAYQEN